MSHYIVLKYHEQGRPGFLHQLFPASKVSLYTEAVLYNTVLYIGLV